MIIFIACPPILQSRNNIFFALEQENYLCNTIDYDSVLNLIMQHITDNNSNVTTLIFSKRYRGIYGEGNILLARNIFMENVSVNPRNIAVSPVNLISLLNLTE